MKSFYVEKAWERTGQFQSFGCAPPMILRLAANSCTAKTVICANIAGMDVLAVQQTVPLVDSDEELLSNFARALQEATRVRVDEARSYEVAFESIDGPHRLDALLTAQMPHEGQVQIAVELLRNAYPRDVRHALWQLNEYLRANTDRDPVLCFVVGHHLSPGAREILRTRGVGYYDAGGSLYFRRGDVLVDIQRPAAAVPPRLKPLDLFTGAREQVVHALLHCRHEWLSGAELASKANTSAFTVSRTLGELERLEWLESEGDGRLAKKRLAQPARLLDAWAQEWIARKEARSRWYLFAQRPQRLPAELKRQLSQAGETGWSLTGAYAGDQYTPLLTSVDTMEMIMPPGQAQRFASAMGAKRADTGANLTLIERSGASELFRHDGPENSAPLASPFIVYLDLLKEDRGRNKELAHHLRNNELRLKE